MIRDFEVARSCGGLSACDLEIERLLRIIATQEEILRADHDHAAIMRSITDRTVDLTGADGAVVEIAHGDEMVYEYASGVAVPSLGLHIKKESSLSGLCLHTGEVQVCEDTEIDPRVNVEVSRRVGVRSMILVPLVHQGETVGVLKAMAHLPAAFNAGDVKALQMMAGFMATAIRQSALEAERAKLQATIEQMAYRDPLTGLPNRALFFDRLARMLALARRQDRLLALMFLDLDGFKKVNDTYGHRAGDDLLKIVAQRLSSHVRDHDTVARLAGDEFTVVMPFLSSPAEAPALASRLWLALNEPAAIGAAQIQPAASIGISLFPRDADAAEVLLQKADKAMYEAKRARSHVLVYRD